MSCFRPHEIDYLNASDVGRLATVAADGTVQNSPVGFTINADLDTIDISGYRMSKSRKFRNLTSNNTVALVIDDIVSHSPWRVRCLEIRGDAEAIENPTDSAANTAGAIIRLHPRRIISFGVDPGNPAAGHRNVA